MHLSEVTEALQSVLHFDRPQAIAAKLYDRLHETLGDAVSEVSAYGYLKYLVSKYGEVAKFQNCILSASAISQFHKVSQTASDDFLVFVSQAAERLEELIAMFGENRVGYIMDGLGESADPAVIYTVLTAVKDDFNSPEVHAKINELWPAANEYFRKFPLVLAKLPDELRKEVSRCGNVGRT